MKVKLKSDFGTKTRGPQLPFAAIRHLKNSAVFYNLPKLTVGKWYEAKLTPNIYDSTFQDYMIICDDGYSRRFPLDYFITLEEWRDSQLGELPL